MSLSRVSAYISLRIHRVFVGWEQLGSIETGDGLLGLELQQSFVHRQL